MVFDPNTSFIPRLPQTLIFLNILPHYEDKLNLNYAIMCLYQSILWGMNRWQKAYEITESV